MFAQDQPTERTLSEPHRLKPRQFAPALQHISQDDDAKACAANEEPQTSKHLEGIQVSVLHGIERIEPRGCRSQFQPGILQAARERRSYLRYGVRRRINQEHSIAACPGKVLEELLLRNQQVSLQDRISDRANKLDFKRPAPLIHVIERIAKVLVQRPADAVVITNRRNNFGRVARIEQRPTIFFVSSSRHSAERKRLAVLNTRESHSEHTP